MILLAPFESTKYEVTLLRHQLEVSWTRPGREWTSAEVHTLQQGVSDEWDKQFGERLQAFESLVTKYNAPILCSPCRLVQ